MEEMSKALHTRGFTLNKKQKATTRATKRSRGKTNKLLETCKHPTSCLLSYSSKKLLDGFDNITWIPSVVFVPNHPRGENDQGVETLEQLSGVSCERKSINLPYQNTHYLAWERAASTKVGLETTLLLRKNSRPVSEQWIQTVCTDDAYIAVLEIVSYPSLSCPTAITKGQPQEKFTPAQCSRLLVFFLKRNGHASRPWL